MATKDIKQSHREYVDRKKRIDITAYYDNRNNAKLNEIKDIEDEIERLTKVKEQKLKERNEINEDKLQTLSRMYNDPDLLLSIIKYTSYTTYSRSNLEDIKNNCSNGINIDDVNLDLMEKIISAEKYINKEIPHTNFLPDILEGIGGMIKFPGEEDDEYDN